MTRHVHHFRQSQLNTAEMCLERSRRETSPLVEHEEHSSDAALYGTVLHCQIERAVVGWLAHEPWPTIDDMMDGWAQDFWPLTAQPQWNWLTLVKDQVEGDALEALTNFRNIVAPRLYPLAAELTFKDLLLYEDDDRTIYLNGTIDYVDRHLGLVDWKTSGRKYDRWEKQRWGIQPTVYTWAWNHLNPSDIEEHDFTYFVFLRSSVGRKAAGVQELKVTRNAGDWAWLEHKALNLARLIERVGWDEEWPLGDSGWWCSPKWCDYWDDCKGKAYTSTAVEWKQ